MLVSACSSGTPRPPPAAGAVTQGGSSSRVLRVIFYWGEGGNVEKTMPRQYSRCKCLNTAKGEVTILLGRVCFIKK